MADRGVVSVRVFGSLHEFQRQCGRPVETTEEVPAEGISAEELAERMGLPIGTIEGVFCNHDIHDLGHTVRPGDKVAFVPYGTPGPHRYFLGLYRAGRKSHDEPTE